LRMAGYRQAVWLPSAVRRTPTGVRGVRSTAAAISTRPCAGQVHAWCSIAQRRGQGGLVAVSGAGYEDLVGYR
jgi:hypothetical protein